MDDGVVDKGPLVLGVVISTLALGGIFIFARVITRTVIRPQFGLDDALIVFTWVCSPLRVKDTSELLSADLVTP